MWFKFSILFLSSALVGQINLNFISHLSNNKLKAEHCFYLKSLAVNDTLNYHKAKYNLQYNNLNDLTDYLATKPQFFFNDSAAVYNTILCFFKNENQYLQNTFLNALDTTALTVTNKKLILNLVELDSKKHLILTNFLPNLEGDLQYYQKIKNKKPVLGAVLSAIVPGLGKWYGGQPNSAFVSFFSQAIYGLQTFETVKKFGFKNGFSIFSMSFFGAFYISNIFGTYTDIIKQKKLRKKNILINEGNYYSNFYPVSLY